MSRDKVTLENPQSHVESDGGGAAALAAVDHPLTTVETPVSAEPKATLDAEPSPSHPLNDDGGG